jgi:hypothetical protein
MTTESLIEQRNGRTWGVTIAILSEGVAECEIPIAHGELAWCAVLVVAGESTTAGRAQWRVAVARMASRVDKQVRVRILRVLLNDRRTVEEVVVIRSEGIARSASEVDQGTRGNG